MDPITMALIGSAVIGAYSGVKKGQREADNQRRTANIKAAQVRYSPWTQRQNFDSIEWAKTDPFSAGAQGLIGGGLTGASLGKAVDGMGPGSEALSTMAGDQAATAAAAQANAQMPTSTSMYAQNDLFKPQGPMSSPYNKWDALLPKSNYAGG